MRIWGWAAVAAAALVLAGCTGDSAESSHVPTTTPIPAGIQEFLDAAVAGDIEVVRSHLAVYNEPAGRNLTASEISTQCAKDEATAVAAKVTDPALTAYVYTATEPWIVRFEYADGASEGWGIVNSDGIWYWQPQAGSCQDLWNSPSPSPS